MTKIKIRKTKIKNLLRIRKIRRLSIKRQKNRKATGNVKNVQNIIVILAMLLYLLDYVQTSISMKEKKNHAIIAILFTIISIIIAQNAITTNANLARMESININF